MRGNGETILVVEDDVDVREAYVDVLHYAGYRVDEAIHGLDARPTCGRTSRRR